MQDLVESFVRFSAAMTLFGMQQLQNAAELATDSQSAMKKMKKSLDAVATALTQQLDEGKRPAVDSVSNLVDRTYTALNVQALDPREMIQTTTDVVRKTTDSLADFMKKAAETPSKSTSGEPQPAAQALKSK